MSLNIIPANFPYYCPDCCYNFLYNLKFEFCNCDDVCQVSVYYRNIYTLLLTDINKYYYTLDFKNNTSLVSNKGKILLKTNRLISQDYIINFHNLKHYL